MILVLEPSGEERHRVEGFLPVEELVPQLEFGLGRVAFSRGDFEDAERRFRRVVEDAPNADVAPEALYWAGVARYKATDDAKALEDTAAAFHDRYQHTTWATKHQSGARTRTVADAETRKVIWRGSAVADES